MIELKSVQKDFGSKTVLQSLSLNLAAEKTHVMIGASGCGKSTLLRLILGLTPPTSGQVIVDGATVNAKNRLAVTRSIGYVVQEGGLFPHLTGAQNVQLIAKVLGWKKDQLESRTEELAQLVQLRPGLLDKFPKQLSGGQRQRIGLMRALMLDPKILLLDEPLGALDPIVRADLQSELRDIFNRLKKTVVIVTHDIGEAAFFGHTITLLKDGEVLQHATFEEMMKVPSHEYVTQFINAQRPPPELQGTS